ncbi:MAG: class II glutamine amidotransferase [Planctomycetota bacterium]|jgi:glutamine amidotransferase
MCRWLAYSGAPIAPTELIFKPEHSLIDQSLSARASETTTNGDGFGLGWYEHCDSPGIYKHTRPAWNDPNLRDVCLHVQSPLFLAHIRAATGTAIQQSNCHPFRYGSWLFVHNGRINGFQQVKRELALGVSEDLYPYITGTTDSEIMFFLSLSFGMEEDVSEGVARMAGFVEDACRRRGIDSAIQMSLGISDGQRLYAFRYSTEGRPRTLFHSKSIAALRKLVPPESRERLAEFSRDARAVVSEPLTELPDPWEEVPESSFLIVEAGEIERRPFAPKLP